MARDAVDGESRPRTAPGTGSLALPALALVLIPLRGLPELSLGHGGSAHVELLDAVLVVVTAIVVRRAAREWPLSRTDWAGRVCLLIVGLLVLSFSFHPSLPGALLVLRVIGVASLALLVRDIDGERGPNILLCAFLGGIVVQALVALGQVVRDGPLGLGLIGELQRPLTHVGTAVAPRGTLQHPYPLAGFVLLGAFAALALLAHRRDRAWFWALAAGATPLGTTYSRAAVLGLLAGVAVLLPALRREGARVAVCILALVLGPAMFAALWPEGWTARARVTLTDVQTRDVDAVATNRGYLARGALSLVRSNPLVGVGPGRYFPGSPSAQATTPEVPDEIVHNLPLYAAVEGGLPLGLVVTGVLLVVGVVAVRRDPLAASVYFAFLPFVLLDRFTYDGVQGLAMTGAWLGTIGFLIRLRGARSGVEVGRPA